MGRRFFPLLCLTHRGVDDKLSVCLPANHNVDFIMLIVMFWCPGLKYSMFTSLDPVFIFVMR